LSSLITHLHRDIADGETFRHKGGIMLHGNVGKGARVEITDGCFKVTGDVGSGATLRTRGDGELLNGGISIGGRTGDDVVLDSDREIRLRDAGSRLRIRAGAGVHFGHVGEGMNLSAGAEVNGGDAGPNAHIRAATSCVMARAGDGSIVRAGKITQVTFAGHDCRITCGDIFNAASVGANTQVTATNTAMIGEAPASAKITARSVRIRQRRP
jgi:hypothetical protein